MAYKDEGKILFVRIPCTEDDRRRINRAAESSGLKKYKWTLNALLRAADAEERKNGNRN